MQNDHIHGLLFVSFLVLFLYSPMHCTMSQMKRNENGTQSYRMYLISFHCVHQTTIIVDMYPEYADFTTASIAQHVTNLGHQNVALQWRQNHQPYVCLLNRLFRRRSKKTSKLRVNGLCAGNSPGPVNSPHKWPVTRKMLPFDDVIMGMQVEDTAQTKEWAFGSYLSCFIVVRHQQVLPISFRIPSWAHVMTNRKSTRGGHVLNQSFRIDNMEWL